MDRADFPVDCAVHFFFCDRLFSPVSLSVGLVEVMLIQPELHRAENDIRALHKHMIMRGNLGDLVPSDSYGRFFFYKVSGCRHFIEKLFKPFAFKAFVGHLIQIDSHIKRREACCLKKAKPMLENFDKALSHPDKSDIERLEKAVLPFLNNI